MRIKIEDLAQKQIQGETTKNTVEAVEKEAVVRRDVRSQGCGQTEGTTDIRVIRG